jgi:hypothetical protein
MREMLYTSPLINFKAGRSDGLALSVNSVGVNSVGGQESDMFGPDRCVTLLKLGGSAPVGALPPLKSLEGKFKMKIRQTTRSLVAVAALLAIALFSAACGKKASTPTEAFKTFYEASKAKDVATIKRLMAKDALSKMEDKAKQANKSLDDFIVDQAQNGIPPSMPETRNEKIDGDNATIEFKGPGGDSDWRTVPFAKEDGEWKIKFR